MMNVLDQLLHLAYVAVFIWGIIEIINGNIIGGLYLSVGSIVLTLFNMWIDNKFKKFAVHAPGEGGSK